MSVFLFILPDVYRPHRKILPPNGKEAKALLKQNKTDQRTFYHQYCRHYLFRENTMTGFVVAFSFLQSSVA